MTKQQSCKMTLAPRKQYLNMIGRREYIARRHLQAFCKLYITRTLSLDIELYRFPARSLVKTILSNLLDTHVYILK